MAFEFIGPGEPLATTAALAETPDPVPGAPVTSRTPVSASQFWVMVDMGSAQTTQDEGPIRVATVGPVSRAPVPRP